jgi:hypothetical protein
MCTYFKLNHETHLLPSIFRYCNFIAMADVPDAVPSTEAVDELNLEKQPTQDEPADGGYGWVNVACMQLLTAHTWGINGVSICPKSRSQTSLC